MRSALAPLDSQALRNTSMQADDDRQVGSKSGLENSENHISHVGKRARKGDVELQEEDDPQMTMPSPGPEQQNPASVQPRSITKTAGVRAGQICNITVVNFMCHEHLSLDLGPNVTLISGANGSGKSAALTALQACLGVRARDTGRFKSVSAFVKHGCPYAVASVTLCNVGEEAYRPQELGSRITIERRIHSKSGGHFKVRDAHGREKLSGAAEVAALVDHFSINAANPVVVLTQDLARGFAGQANEMAKFAFFEQAMHFQEIGANLRAAGERLAEMKATNEEDAETLERAEVELAEKKEALERMQAVSELQAQHETLLKAMAWSQALQARRDLRDLRRIADRVLTPARSAVKLEVKRASRAHLQAERDLATETAKVDRLGSEGQDLMVRSQETRTKRKAAAKTLGEARTALTRARVELERLQSKKRDATDAMRQALARARGDTDDRASVESTRVKLESERAAEALARVEEQAAKNAEVSVRSELGEAESASATARREDDAAEDRLREAGKAVAMADRSVSQLMAGRSDPVARFGGRAALELQRQITNAFSRFSYRPIGPLGAHLALTDEGWAMAAQNILGLHLETYIVNSQHDARQLRDLARRSGLHDISIIVYSFSLPMHQVPDHIGQLSEDYMYVRKLPALRTMLDVLKFPGVGPDQVTVIRNALIDHCKIERNVLVKTPEDAKTVMRNSDLMHRIHASSIWAADGTRAYRRGNSEILVASTIKYTKLSADTQAAEAASRQELADAQAAQAAAREVLERKTAALREAQATVERLLVQSRDAHRKTQQATRALKDCGARIAHLEQVLGAEAALAEGGEEDAMRHMTSELEQLESKAEVVQGLVDQRTSELEKATKESAALDAQAQEQETWRQQVASDLEAATTRVMDLGRDVTTFLADIENCQGMLAEAYEELRFIHRELGKRRVIERGLTKAAEELCPLEEARVAMEEVAAVWEESEARRGRRARMQTDADDAEEEEDDPNIKGGDDVQPMDEDGYDSGGEVTLDGGDLMQVNNCGTYKLPEDTLTVILPVSAADLRLIARLPPVAELSKRLKKLATLIAQRERTAGQSFSELKVAVLRAETDLVLARTRHARADRVWALLRKGAKARRRKLGEMQRLVAVNVDRRFREYLGYRGHRGSVRIDYDARKLVMAVGIAGQELVEDMNALSGGERSIATVCLFMALGHEGMAAPFSCMDEFDVFMDAINRRVALSFLLEFAYKFRHRQFVYLTPQDLVAVREAEEKLAQAKKIIMPQDFVRTVCMPAPRPN